MFIPVEHPDIPIITIDNFLPTNFCNSLLKEVTELKPYFNKSNWTSGIEDELGSKCHGEDMWLPFSEEEDDKNTLLQSGSIVELWRYFFHEGLQNFFDHCKHPEFSLYSKFKYNFSYHIINYPDRGYYNWHVDSTVIGQTWFGYEVNKPTTYTFALTLIDDNENIVSGGHQLFMKSGKIVELQSKNNQLIIFPSNIYHSLCEIKADSNLPWEMRRFNIQAWFCHL